MDGAADQAYGSLTEGVFLSGFTLERAFEKLEWLLTGNRWRSVGGGFDDVNAFMATIKFDTLQATIEPRKRIVSRIKTLQPKASKRAIARTLGVSEGTVRSDIIAQNYAPAGKKTREGKGTEKPGAQNTQGPVTSGARAAKVVGRAERVADRQRSVGERVAKVGFDAERLGKFSVILADPPWDDEFGASNRSIENHYPTMMFADILALPVTSIAHDQAMLFLWATSSMIEKALQTAAVWGFEYRTQMVWVKPSIGLGKYVRQRHEILLICRRGEHPAPDPAKSSGQRRRGTAFGSLSQGGNLPRDHRAHVPRRQPHGVVSAWDAARWLAGVGSRGGAAGGGMMRPAATLDQAAHRADLPQLSLPQSGCRFVQ